MKRLVCALALAAISAAALAQEKSTGAEESAADPAPDAVESPPAAEAKTAGAKEFTPPPGFKTKKSGKHILYCKKDSVVGTRFKTEKCLDEAQMRDYLIALAEQKRDIDRIRSTCASAAACATN
jgi:hypothetical protein